MLIAGRLERWSWGIATAALSASAALWLAACSSFPFGWDQGIFAWAGDEINRGGSPYRDAWDIKGPLAYYGYALAQRVFGRNLWAVRVLDAVLLAAASLCLYRLARTVASRAAALWASLALVAWYAAGSYWHTAQPDGWAAMLVIAGFAAVACGPQPPSRSRLFWAGACIGCAALVKVLFVVFLPVPVLALVPWRRRLGGFAASAAWFAAGFTAPVAGALAWCWHAGFLGDYIEQHLVYTRTIYSPGAGLGLASVLAGIGEYARGSRALQALAPAAVFGVALLYRKRPRTAVLAGGWLAIGLFCVILQNRYYAYHWTLIFGPVILLAAPAIDALLSRSGLTGAAVVLLATAALCSPLRFDILRWARWTAGTLPTERYYADFAVPGPEIQAASYIRSRTVSRDRVAIWGWESGILYMADRRSVSRFGFSMPLLAGSRSALKEKYRAEFLNALAAAPPAYLVIGSLPEAVLGRVVDPRDFSGFYDFVHSRCRPETKFGRLELLRCAGGSANAQAHALPRD